MPSQKIFDFDLIFNFDLKTDLKIFKILSRRFPVKTENWWKTLVRTAGLDSD